jgi:heme a synthase
VPQNSNEAKLQAPPHQGVRTWLLTLFGLVVLMVALGGTVRLTGSGLSMVEWHPLMGAVPPLNATAWGAVFAEYQRSPQFQQVNHWMTLDDFQRIFMWEYLHRLLGRLLGIAFLLPWLYFLVRGQLTGRWAWRTALAFVLGGLQGLLGWYMVQSGLTDRPEVSHLRLAAHLGLAFITALYILWCWLTLRWPTPGERRPGALRTLKALSVLVALQVVYGAFMAGLRAGYLSSTFPLMQGSLFPTQLLSGLSLEEAVVWSPAGVHLIHRALGWVVVLATLGSGLWARRQASTSLQRRLCVALVAMGLAQFFLGALTVLLSVQPVVAVMHQVGALVLMSIITACVYSFGGDRQQERQR